MQRLPVKITRGRFVEAVELAASRSNICANEEAVLLEWARTRAYFVSVGTFWRKGEGPAGATVCCPLAACGIVTEQTFEEPEDRVTDFWQHFDALFQRSAMLRFPNASILEVI